MSSPPNKALKTSARSWRYAEPRLDIQPAFQQGLEIAGVQRLRIQKALRVIATGQGEQHMLFFGGHALGHHFEAQTVRHRNDCLAQGQVIAFGTDVAYEKLIDLQEVDIEALEI